MQENQHRFIDFSLKETEHLRLDIPSDDNPTGSFSGYANVKGYLDSYGTIMADGCYVSCIPELLKNGFIPDTHGIDSGMFAVPTLNNTLGFFSDAKEDEKGLWVKGEFYDTQRAQEARKQIMQRLEAGCTMGLSVGFNAVDYEVIAPEEFESAIKKYVRAENVKKALTDCTKFGCLIIFKKINVYEVSLTLIPANDESLVSEVRTETKTIKTKEKTMALKDEVAALRAEQLAQRSTLAELTEELSEFRAGKKMSSKRLSRLDDGCARVREGMEILSALLSEVRDDVDADEDQDEIDEEMSKERTAPVKENDLITKLRAERKIK